VLTLATERAVQQLAAVIARFSGFVAHSTALHPKYINFIT